VHRFSHGEKQYWQRISTDGGIHIDEREEQPRTDDSTRETVLPAANLISDTLGHPPRQSTLNRVMQLGITISLDDPKHQMIDVPSKLTRKLSITLKCRLSASTRIVLKFVPANAISDNSASAAGRTIEESEGHPVKASSSIRDSFEPDSKVRFERHSHL
jgi:hypothetical protein